MNRGKLRRRVISLLQEEADPRHWTADEINENLNEGQREFNKIARQVRIRIEYAVGLYGNLFPAPTNALSIVSATYWDGNDEILLKIKSRDYLDHAYGSNWQDDIGTDPRIIYEALVQEIPFIGIRDYLSLYPIPNVTAISLDQEDLSAELGTAGVLVWQDDSGTYGIPVGVLEEDVYGVDGAMYGMIIGIYSPATTAELLKIESVKNTKDMTTDGDEPEIREANHMTIVNYALHKCFEREGDQQNIIQSDRYKKKFDNDARINKGQPIVEERKSVEPWRL